MSDTQDRDFTALRQSLSSKDPVVQDNNDVLSAVLGAVAANKFEEIPQYLTEDTELHIQGFPGMDGSWRGQAEVVAAMKNNFGKVTQQAPRVESMIQQGNRIAILLEETGRLTAAGDNYRVRGVIWCTFQDGKLHKVEEYLHSPASQ